EEHRLRPPELEDVAGDLPGGRRDRLRDRLSVVLHRRRRQRPRLLDPDARARVLPHAGAPPTGHEIPQSRSGTRSLHAAASWSMTVPPPDRLRSFIDLLMETIDDPADGAEIARRAFLSR